MKKDKHKKKPASKQGEGHKEKKAEVKQDSSNHDEKEDNKQAHVIPKHGFGVMSWAAIFILPLVGSLVYVYLGNHANSQEDTFHYSHQLFSLHEPFSVDYKNVLKIREENMKKYDFPYDKYGIDRRSGLSLQEYRDVYDGKWPVLITDIVPNWQAYNWTKDFFAQKYGNDRIAIKAVDLNLDLAIAQAFYGSSLDLGPSLDFGPIPPADDYPLPRLSNAMENAVSLAMPLILFYKNAHRANPKQWTYLEDELFIQMRPELLNDIGDYKYLKDDYYQLFPKEVRPWNAMLLWGTQYSRSSLHIDPYNWTGTNAVLMGLKKWKLYPPGQDDLLYVKQNLKSGFPLNCYKYNSPIDSYEPDFLKYPRFAQATAVEFDQHPGELLLIPTGWFHQAYNAIETMAVSSQAMNINNYRIVLEEILKINNLPREKLPEDIDQLPPKEQVQIVMDLLPQSIIDAGRAVTEDILLQIEHGENYREKLNLKSKNGMK